MPLRRRPHIASADEIKISRDGDNAVIEYADDKVATTYFTLGRERLSTMTDDDILMVWNDYLEARDEFMRNYEHVALEIPPGRPQVELFEPCGQWVPRGHVLRCVVLGSSGDDPEEPFVSIDDRDFSLTDFAKMVGTFGGWGMRIVFVPDDELHETPKIKVKDRGAKPRRGRRA